MSKSDSGKFKICKSGVRESHRHQNRLFLGGFDMRSLTAVVITGVLLAMVAFMTGCASSRSGEVYSRDQARQAQILEYATVVSVKEVTIEGTKTALGTAAGGVAGGVLGSTVGGGRGSTVATVIGALAGAAVGTAAEEGATRKPGLEIVVKKDDGPTIVVVQEADVMMAPGDRVKVITAADGTTRVSK